MDEQVKTLGVNRAWWVEPGILHVEYGTSMHRGGQTFTHADALDGQTLVTECIGTRPVVMIADIRNIRKTTRKARKMQPEGSEHIVAILVGCAVTRMIASAYLGLTRPKHTTRVFSNEDLAIDWLRQKAEPILEASAQPVAV